MGECNALCRAPWIKALYKCKIYHFSRSAMANGSMATSNRSGLKLQPCLVERCKGNCAELVLLVLTDTYSEQMCHSFFMDTNPVVRTVIEHSPTNFIVFYSELDFYLRARSLKGPFRPKGQGAHLEKVFQI